MGFRVRFGSKGYEAGKVSLLARLGLPNINTPFLRHEGGIYLIDVFTLHI